MKKLLLVVCGAAISSAGWAITVFDNLVPGSSFSPASEQPANITSGPFIREAGVRFTAGATGTVTSVEAKISGNPSILVFDLYTNASGNVLGTWLGAATGSGSSANPSVASVFLAQGAPSTLTRGNPTGLKRGLFRMEDLWIGMGLRAARPCHCI